MLTSTPKLVFSVDGDIIKMENQPHPDSRPEENAKCEFKLNDEFTFEPKGALFKVSLPLNPKDHNLKLVWFPAYYIIFDNKVVGAGNPD